jgi:hypothetical protein
MVYRKKKLILFMAILLPIQTMAESPWKTAGKVALAGAATALSFFGIYKAVEAYSNYSDASVLDTARLLVEQNSCYNKLIVPVNTNEDSVCRFYDQVKNNFFSNHSSENLPSIMTNHFSCLHESLHSAKNSLDSRIAAHRGKEESIDYCVQGDRTSSDLSYSITKVANLKTFFRSHEPFFMVRSLFTSLQDQCGIACFNDPLAYARMSYSTSLYPYGKLKRWLDSQATTLSKYVNASSVNFSWPIVQAAQAYRRDLLSAAERINHSQEYLVEKQQERLDNQREEELRLLRESNRIARKQAEATQELADARRAEACALDNFLRTVRNQHYKHGSRIQSRINFLIAELERELHNLRYGSSSYNSSQIKRLQEEITSLRLTIVVG